MDRHRAEGMRFRTLNSSAHSLVCQHDAETAVGVENERRGGFTHDLLIPHGTELPALQAFDV